MYNKIFFGTFSFYCGSVSSYQTWYYVRSLSQILQTCINCGRLHEIRYKLKQQTSNTTITQAYHSRCSSWKLSSNARIAWEFWILFNTHQTRWKKKTMPSEVGFPTLTSDASLNQKTINNRLLIAAVFHFVHPVEKDS